MTWHVYLLFGSCYLKLGWGWGVRGKTASKPHCLINDLFATWHNSLSLLPAFFNQIFFKRSVVEKSLSLPEKIQMSLEFLRDYLVTYDSLVLLLFQFTRTYFFLQKIPNKEFFLGRNIEWLDCVAEARKLFGICLNFDNFSQTVMRLIWSI